MGDQPTPYGSPELDINPQETQDSSKTPGLGQPRYSRLLELGSLDIALRFMIRCSRCHDCLEPSGQKVPLLLHCGHSVCLACVREAVTSSVTSSDEEEPTQVHCPADSQLTDVNSRDWQTFGLRRNLTLIEILQKTFQHREQKPRGTSQQDRNPSGTQRQDSQNDHQRRGFQGIPGSHFFYPSNDFPPPVESPPAQINCERVDSFIFEQNVWNNGSESADLRGARDILDRFAKERAKAKAQYILQRKKLQNDLKTALESVHLEQDRQKAEIATLQTSLDDLNASFCEQMQSINYRTNQSEQNSADDDIQGNDSGAVETVVRAKARRADFYLHSLQRLQEETRVNNNHSQLTTRMNSIPNSTNQSTENVDDETSASLDVQYQEQKQRCDHLRLQYEQEKRQHRQTVTRYERILSAKDDTIIAQDADKLELMKRLDEQSKLIRQLQAEPKTGKLTLETGWKIQSDGNNCFELDDPPSLQTPVEETPHQDNSERVRNTIPKVIEQSMGKGVGAQNLDCGTEIEEQSSDVGASDEADGRAASDPEAQADGSDVEANPKTGSRETRGEGSTVHDQGVVDDPVARKEAGDLGDSGEEVFDMTTQTPKQRHSQNGLLRQKSKGSWTDKNYPMRRSGSVDDGKSPRNSGTPSGTPRSSINESFKLKSSISIEKDVHEATVTGVAEIWGFVVVTLANESSLSFYSQGRSPHLQQRHFLRSLKAPSGMAVVQRSNTLVVSDRKCVVFIWVTEDLAEISEREIPLEINPVSVSVNQHNSTILVCSGGGTVQILSDQGTFTEEVRIRKADWVSAIQLKSQFVLLDRCKLSTKSNVVWFNRKGIEEFGHRWNSFDEMNNPEHMVEMRGMVLVADTNNSRVHLLNDSEKLVEYALTSDEICWPDRLYYDEAAGLLLVAQHDGVGSVKVLVFKEQRGILGFV